MTLAGAVIDSLDEGVLICGDGGTLEAWNPAALTLLRITNDPATWYAGLASDSELGRVFTEPRDDVKIQLGGRHVTVTVTTRVLVDDLGERFGRIHIVRASADRPEVVPRATSAGSGRLAHDIKNTLLVLAGALDACVPARAEAHDVIVRAKAALDRLSKLCTELCGAIDGCVMPRDPVSDAEAAAGRRGKILVLDDDALIRSAVLRALQREHDVVPCEKPQQALGAIAKGARFDVILCDILMPGKTGIDFYHELALIAPEQAARIVFLSGAQTPEALAFFEEIPNPRFEKPLRGDALRAIVNQHVNALRAP